MSTYDMDTLDQTACRNCSQDLVLNASYADTSMDNTYWKVEIYNAIGELMDSVERNVVYFPVVRNMYTHELQYENYDNELGGNWEASCYEYGTPQEANQEDCPCNMLKCIDAGDTVAYCGMTILSDAFCGVDWRVIVFCIQAMSSTPRGIQTRNAFAATITYDLFFYF